MVLPEPYFSLSDSRDTSCAIRFFSEPVPQLRDSWDNTWCYRKPRRYRFPPCKASNLKPIYSFIVWCAVNRVLKSTLLSSDGSEKNASCLKEFISMHGVTANLTVFIPTVHTLKGAISSRSTGHGIGVLAFRLTHQRLKIIRNMIRAYYRCCCMNEPVIFSHWVHL